MEFQLLGPLEVVDQHRPIELPAGKPRALLGLLALEAPRVVSVDRVVDGLWGTRPPPTARKIVQAYVSRLRKLFPDGTLETRSPGYRLAVSEEQTDLGRFHRLHAAADAAAGAGRLDAAVALLREALALWRGPPLADVAEQLELSGELAGLEEERLNALEERIEVELALGQDARLIGELEALTAIHSMRERPRRQLMVALYRAGRQAEALEGYRDWRRQLVDDLGLEPSRELRDLERRILDRDPALAVNPASVAPTLETDAPAVESDVMPAVRGRSARVPQPERRKLVTVLCCDLSGSVQLAATADPEAQQSRLDLYMERLQAAVETHGGVVEPFAGYAITAVFGIHAVRDDDGLRALRAALEARDALVELGAEPQLGIAGGEVVVGPSGRPATGEPVRLAARLARAAPMQGVLLDETTFRMTHASIEAEPYDALDWAGPPMRPRRLLAVDPGRPLRPFDSPFVGRQAELDALTRAWGRVTSRRSCELATIVGPAGVGKSRLVQEFRESVDAHVVAGRCLSYGEGITYLPLLEVVEQLEPLPATLAASARDPLAVLAGEDGVTSTDEVAWAARKLLEAAASERPLVAIFDDIQWAEVVFLELIEHIALLSTGAPILLVCLARPELLEDRPGWPVVLRLEPLPPHEVERVVDVRLALAGRGVSAAARTRIVRAADGNPLFAEELVAATLAADGAEMRVPPTIQALLAARLDQLAEPERQLLEAAAVEGEVFHHGVLAALGPDQAQLTSLLTGLARKDVIRSADQRETDDDSFRFRHLLLRDAAYNATPKRRRADLHERLAEVLEPRTGQSGEPDEIIAFHLEQAHSYEAELAPDSDRARALGRRAATLLTTAGRRALTRADVLAAASLLQRAVELDDRPNRPIGPELDLAEALYACGSLEDAGVVLTRAGERATAAGNRSDELSALLARGVHELATDTESALGRLEKLAGEALAECGEANNDTGLTQAWFALANVAHVRARFATRNAALEHALAHATRSGDLAKARTMEVLLAAGQLYGPTPVNEGLSWLDAHPHLDREPIVIGIHAVLEAMSGRIAEGRLLCRQAAARSQELGTRYERGGWYPEYHVELLAGDAAAAADYARAGCARLERMGERSVLSTLAGQLGQALCVLQRYDEATEWSQLAKELGAGEDVLTQLLWRQIDAKVLAHGGKAEAAERLAREAVSIAELSDALDVRADALLDLAEVLEVAGETEAAAQATSKARALYERKGNVVMAKRTSPPRLRQAGAPQEH